MLDILTRSKIRRKIILLFVYNKERDFYLSEIAAQVKTSAGTAQRELNRLLALDLLEFRKLGNLSLYRFKKANPLAKDIESIVRKTSGAEFELRGALSRIRGVSAAFIFGSFARGDLKSGSDIDLYVIGSPSEDKIYDAVQAVEENVGREINYHIAGEAEFARKAASTSFHKEILAKPLMIVGTEDDLRKIVGQAGQGR